MFNPRVKKAFEIVVLVCGLMAMAWLMAVAGLPVFAAPSGPQTFISPIGNPRLNISKQADNAAPVPGTLLKYTLSYSNSVPGSQGFNVRLYDFLPAGVQFVSSNPAVTPDANGVLLFSAPSVGPGTGNQDVTVWVRVLEGFPQITNHALVVADGVTPTVATLATQVSSLPVAQLRVTKSGYSYALINSQLVYQLRCENIGTGALTNVTLVDVLPGGLTLVGASPPPDVVTLPLLRWSVGALAPQQSRTFVITATAPNLVTVITNTALADATQNPLTTTFYATRVVTEGVILRVTKDGSAAAVKVGDRLVYTLRYENAGNQLATGVRLTETLPLSITVVAADPAPSSLNAQYAVWQLGTLSAGATGKIVITTTVNPPADRVLHNAAFITAQPGSVPGQAELDTTVVPYRLYLPVVFRSH